MSFVKRKCQGQGLRALVFFVLPIIFTAELVFAAQGGPVVKLVTLGFCVLKLFIGQPK